MSNYKDLQVWQQSIDFVVEILLKVVDAVERMLVPLRKRCSE